MIGKTGVVIKTSLPKVPDADGVKSSSQGKKRTRTGSIHEAPNPPKIAKENPRSRNVGLLSRKLVSYKGRRGNMFCKTVKKSGDASKKLDLFKMKKKDRKKMRQQQNNKFYQLQLDAKKLWEKLRRSDVRSEEKHKVAENLYQLTKGKLVSIIEAHDTSRVIECLYSNGNSEIKNSVFDEVKDKILRYAKCKYAKNVLLAFLRHGSQTHKEAIYKAMQTHVVELFLHKEAAVVVSTLYDDFCNGKRRAELAQEFYSPELVYFKDAKATTFKAVYEACSDKSKKEQMLSSFKEKMMKLTDKGVVMYGLYHMLLHQLFEVFENSAERLDTIRQIQHIIAGILHTKEGAHVALQCIWHSTAKERKGIAKSFKQFVGKIAVNDQGHKVLLGLFDSVDDTVLLNQCIISELMKGCGELLQNKYGARVFVYLMVGRDQNVIPLETIELLKQGDGNEHSKKPAELRRVELRKFVQPRLIEVICEQLADLVVGPNASGHGGDTSVAVRDIILAADEEFRRNAFAAVIRLLEVPYEKKNEANLNHSDSVVESANSIHIVESKQGNFFLKKLILHDKEKNTADFCRSLLEASYGEAAVRSWWRCNRGAFLCVSILEVKDQKVRNWALDILQKDATEIAKENSKGAELLLQKLSPA